MSRLSQTTYTGQIRQLNKRIEFLNRVVESQAIALASAWTQRNWAIRELREAGVKPSKYDPRETLDLFGMATMFQVTPDLAIFKLESTQDWVISSESYGCYCEGGWEEGGDIVRFPSSIAALAFFQSHPELFLTNVPELVSSPLTTSAVGL